MPLSFTARQEQLPSPEQMAQSVHSMSPEQRHAGGNEAKAQRLTHSRRTSGTRRDEYEARRRQHLIRQEDGDIDFRFSLEAVAGPDNFALVLSIRVSWVRIPHGLLFDRFQSYIGMLCRLSVGVQ